MERQRRISSGLMSLLSTIRDFTSFFSVSLIVVGLLLVGQVYAEGATKPNTPKLQLVAPVFDFGTVSQGTVVKHEFLIKNVGNADLKLEKLVPGCGCTASSVSSDTVPPSGEERILVEFDTTGFAGEKLKSVRIYSNDPEVSVAVLTVKGFVQVDVSTTPSRLFFDVVTSGEKARKDVVVSVRDGAKATITEVSSRSPYLDVKLDVAPGKDPAKFRRITVTLKENAPLGELRERIVVGVKDGARRAINVPVFASIKGPLRFEPGTLSFGIIKGQEPISRKIKLVNHGSQPVAVHRVETDAKELDVSYTELKRGEAYLLEVTLDPSQIRKNLKSVVKVVTDSAEQKEVTLNVFGVLPPS